MAGLNWLSTSLSEEPGIFGDFYQCLTFGSGTQLDALGSSNPSVEPLPSPNTTTLESEDEVYAYVDAAEKSRLDTCIVAFANRSRKDNGRLPLPVSRKLFEHIVLVFNLSATFLTVLTTGLATYTSTVLPKGRKDGKEWENAQFVIQQNRAYSAFSMAVTFGIETGKTRILLFGAEPSQLGKLFEYLSSMLPQPYGPMVAPIAAMELQAQWINKTMNDCQGRIHSIESTTGMRQSNYAHEIGDTEPRDWRILDLISITRDLSSFLSRFAFVKMQAETGVYLLQQMTRTTELLMEKLNKDQRESEVNDQFGIISKLDHVQSWYLGIAARCRYITERTAAQSQTVYCLIASHDNSTNMEIARASHDIAKESHKENESMRALAQLGRQDNELMIRVAEDSRTIAIATARDSAAMQVIAAVTILFLPATFTATFFSMTFFNFLDAEGPHVSSWIWIYVLSTVILTVMIQSAWAVLSKRKRAKVTHGISTGLSD